MATAPAAHMKILVIRLKQIGDALLSRPVCASLRKTYPEARIDYLVYEHIAPLFANDPAIDNVRVITPRQRDNQWLYFRMVLALRRQHYDIVIDLHTAPVSVFTTLMSGAPVQIGFDKGKWRSRLYKTAVPHRGELGALDSKLGILDGLPGPVQRDRTMKLFLEPAEVLAAAERLRSHGLDLQRTILLFSPISRLGEKNWPPDYFVSLIDHCLAACDAQAVLIWGPGEREAVQAIASRVDREHRVCAELATDTLRELAAVAANCALFIGNDSGPRHIAEAAGIPTFTLFAPMVKKSVWIPNPGVRHRAVDMTDLLKIDDAGWFELAGDFRSRMDEYYRRMTPQFVQERLDPMLTELGLLKS